MSHTVTQIPFLKTRQRSHTDRDVLFSGVRELVLSAAVVGLLDPWVGPQALDSCNVGVVETVDLLDVHLLHEHGVRLERHRQGRKKGEIKSRRRITMNGSEH